MNSLLLLPVLSLIALVSSVSSVSAASADPVSFRKEIAPLLVSRCLGCHNDAKPENGLNLKTFSLLREGGITLGRGILEPGDPEASHLIAVLKPDASPRMPLQQAALKEPEIELLERWVKEGAKFDGPSETETLLSSLVDPLADLPKVAPRRPVHPPITALSVAPDGKRFAIGRGRECLLLDTASGQIPKSFGEFDGLVQAIGFSPDGKSLIAAGGRPGQFGSISVWDLATMEKTRSLRGHADAILALAISPDGKTLATASYDRLLKLWNLQDGSEIHTLKEHTDAVYAIAFSPDGSRLASAAGDRTVKVWDASTGQKLISLSDSTAELYALVFAPDGTRLLAAGVDKSIRAWRLDGQTATLEHSVFAHEGAVNRLTTLPALGLLASAGEDRRIKLWDLASLEPRQVSEVLTDWPLSLCGLAEGPMFLAGLYDGSVVRFNDHLQISGKPLDPSAPRDTAVGRTAALADELKPAEVKKPELVRNASLGAPSPRGGVRGSTVVLKLNGQGVGQATQIHFSAPGLTATLKPREPADPNAIDAVLTIAPNAPTGVHRFWVRTPLGTPGSQLFTVSAEPETAEVEPNDTLANATKAPLPSTLVGAIDKPGEIDQFQFPAEQGQTLVFQLLARGLGSALNGLLELRDEQGATLATARRSDDGREPVLVYHVERAGELRLSVADTDLGGSGGHFYRIRAGSNPLLRSVWPLAVEIQQEPSARQPELQGHGENLPSVKVPAQVASGLKPGTLIEVPSLALPGTEAWSGAGSRKIVAVEGPVDVETAAANDTPEQAVKISSPGGFSGRIDSPGDVDYVRFEAKRGERWVVEVHGRRLGSPLDSVIEVLDADGRSVPRAVLRPVRETTVAFRDHNSSGKSIRLTWPWNGFEPGDHVLIGKELLRIQELPRNPDDDAVFWGTGGTRFNSGERMAYLGTTPEHHAQGQTISKVEVHPPGATFPAGGQRPVTLTYRNDDGGPGLDKDSWILFEAPADGSYVVRVEDVRGLGGPEVGYHLSVRKARPDFRVSLASNTPNIPRGAGVFVPVNLERIDGFRGSVEVHVQGLPAGIRAAPTVIEQDQYTADLLFLADADAPVDTGLSHWSLVGRGVSYLVAEADTTKASDTPWVRENLSSAGGSANWISVLSAPNVGIRPSAEVVRIKPGQDVTLNLAIERRNGFAGRVPIDVRNLPYGVAVQNIGLNGVLVTEQISERSITLHAEPWVKPQARAFFTVAKCEAAGTEAASVPIVLEVESMSENE